MTTDEQQIAIATACGWKIANPENDRADYRHWTPPNCVARPKYMYLDRPPNNLNDLNAMHEAEQVLTEKQQRDFCFRLLLKLVDGSLTSDLNDHFIFLHATADQRAEAFLRTLGLWQETSTQPQ